MSGSSTGSLFKKTTKAAEALGGDPAAPEVPQVPIERVVASPRRTTGKGRRDTILTGSDGLL